MKNVLVTGANRGLGLEFVRQLANGVFSDTLNVIATCRDPENAAELKKIKSSSKIKVHIIKLDVSGEDDFQQLATQVGEALGSGQNLTLLINNAGVGDKITFDKLTKADMERFLRVNSVAPMMIAKALLPSLSSSANLWDSSRDEMSCSKAAIVNISSGLSSFGLVVPQNIGAVLQMNNLTAYRVSKTALNMGMHCLADETRSLGILVILMGPGWVKTDMGGSSADLSPQDSVSAMLKSMATFNQEHHGGLFNRDGQVIPW